MTRIAIVGLGCRYPDAGSPQELWENVLAGRRAFRRLPDERMRLDDYWAEDPTVPDRFYARNAAVIQGYEFDRLKYRIAGSTYRSTDLTHWLALDTAARALADAGFPGAEGLPRERTMVVVGNTLTGEFTRANVMRLRWPYVRRTVAAALKAQGWEDDQLASFMDGLERSYKNPFPPIDEDTLAGGLSNTIAGRICNYFDLNGGGYTVDGACSSSLLSVATACRALADGEADVGIAGGVDLSIDPFEIIGFAKTGALAKTEMRVYDRRSNGFWPGEGCGMVVLMRESEARAAGHRVYASIAGWGISSDGSGGITRPEISGYRLALRRAYERAGFGVHTVPLFEGHGTGTEVGDATELKALSLARRAGDPTAPPAAIGSIKGMIGHTKAAAGVASLIKATLSVHHQVLPPTTGCYDPHPELTVESPALRVLRKAEPWPDGAPVRAGITSMGFGGINTHLVVDAGHTARRVAFNGRLRTLASSVQDAELLLLAAATPGELREQVDRLLVLVPRLAQAELADLAATLQRQLREEPYRAAVVAGTPVEAERKLRSLLAAVDEGRTSVMEAVDGIFLGHVTRPGRIGYLFPGQGSGRGVSGGALRRRFRDAEEVYLRAPLPSGGDVVATAVAQPRIVTGSVAALRVLSSLGVEASVGVGHSLGEITALHWAHAMEEDTLLRVATVRGATMAEHSESGTMASIAAGSEVVERLLGGEPVVIAGYNTPQQTVIAGPVDAVERVCQAAGEAGLGWTRLRVSHAFHSPLVAPAADAFADKLPEHEFGPVSRRIHSTVTGEVLAPDTDVPQLLRRQIVDPVRFAEAAAAAAREVDLFIEVGPGRVLSGMVRDLASVPAVATNTDDESLTSFLAVVGAAYAVGAPLATEELFAGRLTRPLDLDVEFRFFASPCEAAPQITVAAVSGETAGTPSEGATQPVRGSDGASADGSLALLRRLAAERAELPVETVHEDTRLLDDLHLSSITVGQLMNQAAREMGLSATQAPTNFATATVRELAEALDAVAQTGAEADQPATVAGVASWVRAFRVDWLPTPVPEPTGREPDGEWRIFAEPDHPLAEPLRRALSSAGVGSGVAVCLPEDCQEEHLARALEGVQAAVSQPGGRLLLVQHGRGAAGLAKTARLEGTQLKTTVVDLPFDAAAADRLVAEVAATTGYAEARYDADGTRRVPVLRPLPPEPTAQAAPVLGADDVLLVTGGGKGITAECALAVATDTGAALAVLGRSDPADDAELAGNLARMRDAGVRVHYARADVTDAAAVQAAVAEVGAALGPVTAVLHGAGRNEPAGLTTLDRQAFRRTLAPKIDGLHAVLNAVGCGSLRLLVTFGSIIGRAGLRGEAHYSTANEWLADLTDAVGRNHPDCRALCVEWSVWSGVGMGERLSVVESLLRDGVTPITPEQGVAVMRRLLTDPEVPSVVVVTGRADHLDTIRYERPELPLLRFVEQPLVHYPGVELVTEAELTTGSDPYLDDHRLDGNLLLPAVLGMEAMAQVASALSGHQGVPAVENAEFVRPIVVPPQGATTVRVAALVTGADTVDVAIRSSETAFGADHFRATLRFGAATVAGDEPEPAGADLSLVPLDPPRELYGDLLFQGKRFQRLLRYRRVAARRAEADVATNDAPWWFSTFLPSQLILGDPGARDAFMHGIQVCVPDATLLPGGVERIEFGGSALAEAKEVTFVAVERHHEGDTYVYDVVARDPAGTVVERWTGLRLHAVRKLDGRGPWAPPLLGPFLQRQLGDVLGVDVAVAVEPSDGARNRTVSATALSRALGRRVRVKYRPDGRPEVGGDVSVSVGHGGSVTLAVAAPGPLGCDIEQVVPRPAEVWDDLLGQHRELAGLIATETGDSPDAAATRVWCAKECVAKAGLPPTEPLTLLPRTRDGWSVLAAGDLRVATFLTSLRGVEGPVVVAVLTQGKG